MAQSMPANTQLTLELPAEKALIEAIGAPGATPATIPATLVPWLLALWFRVRPLPVTSTEAATRQPLGTPGALQEPNAGRV